MNMTTHGQAPSTTNSLFEVLDGLLALFKPVPPFGRHTFEIFARCMIPTLEWVSEHSVLSCSEKYLVALREFIRNPNKCGLSSLRYRERRGMGTGIDSVTSHPVLAAFVFQHEFSEPGIIVLRGLLLVALFRTETAWSGDNNPANATNTKFIADHVRFALAANTHAALGGTVRKVLEAATAGGVKPNSVLNKLQAIKNQESLEAFISKNLSDAEHERALTDVHRLLVLLIRILEPNPSVVAALPESFQEENHGERGRFSSGKPPPSRDHAREPRLHLGPSVERPECVDTRGVAPEDSRPSAFIQHVQLDKETLEATPPQFTYRRERARAYLQAQMAIMDNQYLPTDWSALTAEEMRVLQEVIDDVRSTSPLMALVTDLVVCTATHADMLPHISLLPIETVANDLSIRATLDIDSGVLAHRTPRPEQAFKPSALQKQYLSDVSDWVELQLPQRVAELLRGACKPEFTSLDDLFVDRQKHPEELVDEVVTRLQHQFGSHITANRLAECLLYSLYRHTSDPVISLYIAGDTYRSIPTAAYYTTVSREHLNDTYQAVLNLMGYKPAAPMSPPLGWTGSHLAPEPAVLMDYVKSLAEAAMSNLAHIMDLPSLVKAHNAYVIYTLRLLQFSTGHREVNDPFERRSSFILDEGLVIITDKVVDEGTAGRLAVLPDIAIQQVNQYIRHVMALANRLEVFCPKSPLFEAMRDIVRPLEEAPRMPFLFLMREDAMDWLGIDPSSLEQHDAYWLLPGNAARHVLISALCSAGCPEEYRSAQLGHAGAGQRPYSSVSLLSPRDVRQRVAPMINKILIDQGWAAIKGLRDMGRSSRGQAPASIFASRAFGAEHREIVREGRRIQRRRVVEQECSLHWEDFRQKRSPLPAPSQETLNEIEKILLNYGTTVGPSLVNIFRVKLRLLGRRHRWASIERGHYFVAPSEPAGISYRDGFGIHAVRLLRESLAWYVLDNPESHPAKVDIESLLWMVLSSLVLFDHLIDERYLKSDVNTHLLSKVVRNHALVWVDWQEDNTPLRRLILHPVTIGLLAHLVLRASEINGHAMNLKKLPAFLQRVASDYGRAKGVAPIRQFNLSALMEWADKEGQVTLPGVAAAYASGRIDSWSLSEGSWLRLVANKRLKTDSSTPSSKHAEIKLVKNGSDLAYGTPHELGNALVPPTMWKSLRNEMDSVLHQPPRGRKAQLRMAFQRLMTEVDPRSTFSLLQAWGLYLLSDERKLKASSVVRYVKANIAGLQCEANDVRLLTADEFGLSACYEAALRFSEDKSRPYNAARLKDFHDFLVQSYAAMMVDFYELEPRMGRGVTDVDASIVTPAESELLLQAMEGEHPKITDSERVRVRIQHGLYMDSGLRAGEPFALRDLDVQDHNLRLRSTIYADLKTSNARRVVQLSARTRQWLAGWLTSRRARPDYDDKHQLLNIMGRDAIRIGSIPRWYMRGLHEASGDFSLSIISFRHASATTTMLCAAGVDHPAQWGLEDVYEARQQSLLGLLNISYPSRRMSFLLALQHGHGHPKTTFAHYAHGLDILLFDRCTNGFSLSRRQAARLFEITSENYVSKLLAQNHAGASPLEPLITHGNGKSICADHASMEQRPSALNLDVSPSPAPLSFSNIHSLLVLARRGLEHEHLAETFDWPIEIVKRVISRAQSIESKTGYRPYKFGVRVESGWPGQEVIIPAAGAGQNLHHQFLERDIVKHIETRVLLSPPDPDLVRILCLWEQGIRARGRAMFFTSLNLTREFIDRLESLGLDRASIDAKVSTSLYEHPGARQLIDSYMSDLQLQKQSRFYARAANLNGRVYPLGIALAPNEKAGQAAFNISCFLAICAQSFQSELGSAIDIN